MKRLVAAPLWFLVGWYVASVIAWTFSLGPLLAPIVGVALATLIVLDPRRVIWDRPATDKPESVVRAPSSADAHTV